MTGYSIEGEYQVLGLISKLAEIKREHDKIENALNQAKEIGYGLVSPSIDEMELAEPEIYRQGNKFGVKLKAKAPSLHVDSNKMMFEFPRKRYNRNAEPVRVKVTDINLCIAI